MPDETRATLYLRLLREEAEAFQRASEQSEKSGPARREALAREWFAASTLLVREHMRLHAQPDASSSILPYPLDAIGRLTSLAEAFSVGRVPQPVQDVTANGGQPNRWPGARRDIATALDYIQHARSGTVSDNAYIKRISEAFKVDRTTVRDWQRESEEIRKGLPLMPAHRFPKALKKAGARYHYNRTGERTEGVD